MKKKGLTLLTILFIATFLIACGGGLEELHVEIEVKPIIHDDGSVSFEVVTNLPDSTSLTLTLQRAGENSGPQSTVTVQNGTATSEKMSDQQQPIFGNQTLVISMSLPHLQDESVLAIIGNDGEALVGPLVETTEYDSNVVRAEFDINFDEFLAEVYVIEFRGLELQFPREVIFISNDDRNLWIYAAEGDRTTMIAIHYEPVDISYVVEAELERFILEATLVDDVSNIYRHHDSDTLFFSKKVSYVRVINGVDYDITMYVIPLGNTGILSAAIIEKSEGSRFDLSNEFRFMLANLELDTFID